MKNFNPFSKQHTRFYDLIEKASYVIYRYQVYPLKKCEYINSACTEMWGYNPEQFYNDPELFFKLIPPGDHNVFYDAFANDASSHDTPEFRISSSSGKIIYCESKMTPITSEDGKLIAIEGIIRDITNERLFEEELKVAKEKAEEINRFKTNLLANISHELRTPLVGIIGFAEIIERETINEYHDEMLKMIIESGKRLSRTLNLLLDLTLLESNKFSLKFEVFDFIEQLKHTVAGFKRLAGQKNLAFSVYTPDTLIVYSDREIIRQIIISIVENAVKFTNEGGISVSVFSDFYEDSFCAILQISDTGIGIDKDSQSIIFDEFRQQSEGLSRQYEGIGLGLTLCKKLVEYLKGKIVLKSSVGKGTTFTVYLPILYTDGLNYINSDAYLVNLRNLLGTKKLNMLIVEDDVISRRVVKRMLEGAGSIDDVSTGDEAIESAAKKKYDIIFMDIRLSGMDGIETANNIKAIQSYENVPIVAVTAYAMKGDKEKFLSGGFTYYISKPFGAREILELLIKIFT